MSNSAVRNPNSYYNESIGFYIEKPDDWVFFPTQWAINIRKKTAYANEDIALIMQQAALPFVYMQKPLARDDLAYPTAQATCRYFTQPDKNKMAQFARLQIQVLERSFSDFQLISQSVEEMIAGFPASYFKGTFSIKNDSGNRFQCLSQSWSVFTSQLCFTIGISGSPENFADYAADIDIMLRSIIIE